MKEKVSRITQFDGTYFFGILNSFLAFISSGVRVVTALRPIVKVSLPDLYLALCALMAAQFLLKTAFRRAVSSALAKCNLYVVYNPQNTFKQFQ
jgi:hypothetical protein